MSTQKGVEERKRKDPRHVHCDKGAYVGGGWVDMEDLAEQYLIGAKGSHTKCGNGCSVCPRSASRNSAARPDGSYDVIVIGAGCIGSAISRELSKTTNSILLLEAADDVTQGATKGNSGIVHAGYDDKPGTVKSKYCWKGNQMFPQLDRELHFGYQQNGSLVVAKTEADMKLLDTLMARGDENKVKNLRILNRKELLEKEPWIHDDAIGALYSPDAGTITPYEYTIALAENAVDNGVELRTRRQVVNIEQVNEANEDDGAEVGGNSRQGSSKSNTTKKGRFKVTVNHWEPETTAVRLNKEIKNSSSAGGGLTPFFMLLSLSMVGSSIYVARHHNSNDYALYGCVIGSLCLMVYGVLALLQSDSTTTVTDKIQTLLYSAQNQYEPSKNTILSGLSRKEIYYCDYIVNCGGTKSDAIAKMVGDDSFIVKPRMGEYILLHKDEGHKTTHTLFPCPHPVYGKGVLVQGTLWGNLILGPTARDTMKKNKEGKYIIDQDVANEPVDNIMGYILSKCRNLIPSFDASRVIHTFSGARAKNSTGEWIIGPVPNVPGFINAASIDSPGIAASPAIAADVVHMLGEAGMSVEKDTEFNPFRAPLVMPKNGPYLAVGVNEKGKKKLLKYDKDNTGKNKDPTVNVVCKCEKVTEQEIIDACHRSLPIDSTQALRKRVRCGMGHCQGDPNNYDCETRAAAIIARETGLPLNEVGRRPWPASSMLKERHVYEDDQEKEKLVQLSQPGQNFSLAGAAT